MARSSNPRAARKDSSLGVGVIAICAMLFLGLVAYIKLTPADRIPADQLRDRSPAASVPQVRLLTPKFIGDELRFDATQSSAPAGANPMVYAVNEFLGHVKAVPNGARATAVTVKDGLATLDFSGAFAQTYGTEDEQVILNGILTVMGQFSEVRSVQITVVGRPIETLGNVEIMDPQPVIRPTAQTVSDKPAGTPTTSQ